MLAVNFSDGGIDVAVFAGVDEVVVVGGAANTAPHIAKDYERQLLEYLLRCQRRRKAQSCNIGIQVRWISLILIMPGEGVPQIHYGGGIERQIVGYEDVATVSDVFRIVRIPSAGKDIGLGEDKFVIGKAGEDVLPVALGPIQSNVESVRLVWVQSGLTVIVLNIGGCRITGCRAGEITHWHLRQIQQTDGVWVGYYISGKRLPVAAYIGPGRVVNHGRPGRVIEKGGEVTDSFGGGWNAKVVDSLELDLLRVFVVPKKEELIFLDRSADRTTLLVTVEIRRGVGLAAAQLGLLIEVFVGG